MEIIIWPEKGRGYAQAIPDDVCRRWGHSWATDRAVQSRAVPAVTGRQNLLAAMDWANLSKACAAGVLASGNSMEASGNSMDAKRLLTVQNLSVLRVPYTIRKKALAVLLPAAAGTCMTVWLTAEWSCMCLRNSQMGETVTHLRLWVQPSVAKFLC